MRAMIKVAGHALLAVLVLGAVVASTASAKFDADASSVTIEGEQPAGNKHVFTVKAGSTTCDVAKFHSLSAATTTGTQSFPTNTGGGLFTSETITVEAIYQVCKNNLLGNMNVLMNDCDYRFTAGETESASTVKGEVKVVCHAGGKIEIVRSEPGNPCTITVAEQEVPGILYHNEGATTNTKDVKVTAQINTIKYTQDGLFCPGGAGTFTDGVYNGEATVKGTNLAKEQVGIQVT